MDCLKSFKPSEDTSHSTLLDFEAQADVLAEGACVERDDRLSEPGVEGFQLSFNRSQAFGCKPTF